ncbi:MAG: hypothetical protein LCH61_01025 [Proteobacteria bacterium]|nr:hypothetical protein [Pseudomonadota bacterium]
MTARHFLPVHLPEFETAETPAPDHLGQPYRAALPNAGEVVAGLYAMAHRQTFQPDGDKLIADTIRLIEYVRKRVSL